MQSQEELNKQLQRETVQYKRAFSKFKVKLDKALSIDEFNSLGVFRAPFMSVWVSGYSSSKFNAFLLPNYLTDQGEGIALKPNMSLNFEKLVDGLRIYSEENQPAEWIELTIAHYSNIDSGSVAVDVSGNTSLSDGSGYSMGLNSVDETTILLIQPSDNRIVLTLENRGASSIFLGPESDCNDADYQSKVIEVSAGQSFQWRNSSALYARSAALNESIFIIEENIQ